MFIRIFSNRKCRGLFIMAAAVLWIAVTLDSTLPHAGRWAIGIALFLSGLYQCISRSKPMDDTRSPGEIDSSRRGFLTFAATLAHDEGLQAIQNKVASGASAFTGKRNPRSRYPLLPAGADTFERFKMQCNSCLACIQSCPSHVLEAGVKIGQGVLPQRSFRAGWCEPSCHVCGDVCPTGAIKPLPSPERALVQTGHAVWIKENCQLTDGGTCNACVDACPHQCIEKVSNGRKTYILVNNHRCTGCGACEFSCLSSPLKGIYVEAECNHKTLLP